MQTAYDNILIVMVLKYRIEYTLHLLQAAIRLSIIQLATSWVWGSCLLHR